MQGSCFHPRVEDSEISARIKQAFQDPVVTFKGSDDHGIVARRSVLLVHISAGVQEPFNGLEVIGFDGSHQSGHC